MRQLTLDLESKALPDRPASRLSTISAFFKPSPQSIRVPAAGGAKLNFSRPLYRLRTASTASYRSKASDHSVTRKVPFIDEERKGMEWIRGEALEIMGQPDKAGVASAMRPETEMITSTSVPHQDPPTTQSSYPAERRKRPLPNGLDRVFPLPDVNIQSNPPNLDSVELDVAGFTVSSISNPPKSRRLFPSEPVSSIRERRESQGRPIPTLHLSREAITPSLWLDDELNAMFSRESQSDGPYGGIDPGSVEIKPRSESRLGRKWVDDEEEEMLVSVCHS